MNLQKTSLAFAPEPATHPILEVDDLKVHFPTVDGLVRAVDGVSFRLDRGETLAIVGESGSGKSVTGQAIMGLHRVGRITGRVLLDGVDIAAYSQRQMRDVRGSEIAMVFQDPLSAFHPYYTIGQQITEAIRVHRPVARKAARARAVEVLELVGIPNPTVRVDEYPHEFSGGMRQRAMIAMSIVNEPKVLIADEPTTALDVTVQAQILELMVGLQQALGTATIIITHDLGVVADIADRVLIMYAGRVQEVGSAREALVDPRHPYTNGLLASMPRLDQPRAARLRSIPGTPPSMIAPPSGCAFHPRCPNRDDAAGCSTVEPALEVSGPGRQLRCLRPDAPRAFALTPVAPVAPVAPRTPTDPTTEEDA